LTTSSPFSGFAADRGQSSTEAFGPFLLIQLPSLSLVFLISHLFCHWPCLFHAFPEQEPQFFLGNSAGHTPQQFSFSSTFLSCRSPSAPSGSALVDRVRSRAVSRFFVPQLFPVEPVVSFFFPFSLRSPPFPPPPLSSYAAFSQRKAESLTSRCFFSQVFSPSLQFLSWPWLGIF